MKTMDSLIAERDDAENRADYAEARLAECEDLLRVEIATSQQLRTALTDLFDAMWSCNACGRHPSSTARWCDAGCGSDANRMTRPKHQMTQARKREIESLLAESPLAKDTPNGK